MNLNQMTPDVPSQKQLERDYINKFMNRDKSLKWVNTLFILIGVIGIPFIILGFFYTFMLNSMWGAEINSKSILGLILFLSLPFLSLFIPYFLNRGHKWSYWLGIFTLAILVVFHSKEFLFHYTQGIPDVVRYPTDSIIVFIFVVFSLMSIKTLYRIQKTLA